MFKINQQQQQQHRLYKFTIIYTKPPHFPLRGKVSWRSKRKRAVCWSVILLVYGWSLHKKYTFWSFIQLLFNLNHTFVQSNIKEDKKNYCEKRDSKIFVFLKINSRGEGFNHKFSLCLQTFSSPTEQLFLLQGLDLILNILHGL